MRYLLRPLSRSDQTLAASGSLPNLAAARMHTYSCTAFTEASFHACRLFASIVIDNIPQRSPTQPEILEYSLL